MRLDEWESHLALDAVHKASIAALQEATLSKPVPSHLLEEASRPSTPLSALRKTRLGLHSPRLKRSIAPTEDVPQSPIDTVAQFHDWYSTHIEAAIESEQLTQYIDYLNTVNAYVAACSETLDSLQNMQGYLKELEANYKFVEENSRVLQEACEEMLREQKHLIDVSQSINARLAYFRELEQATKQLNLPGEALVLEPDFLNLLDRLDVCLDFLKANRNFKDAEVYLIRFQQCLTRSMTLIKLYFVTLISNLTLQIGEKLAPAGRELSETARHALQYSKFSAKAPETRVLLHEVEKRALLDPDEYSSLLTECYETWFAARSAVISDMVAEEVRRMEPYTEELIRLTRSGCSYLRSVCSAEWNLFGEFFSSTGEQRIYEYLETLCDHLYDFLRPRILHESSLDKLCELCTVLQALIALDPSGDADEDDQDATFAASPLELPSVETPTSSYFAHAQLQTSTSQQQRTASKLKSLRFSRLLLTILQDAQTRLVFRAQALIHSEVLHYTPTSDDLAYPEKLKQSKRLSLWLASRNGSENEERSLALKDRLPDPDIQESWYPTLIKTLFVLSRLHTFVNMAIFEDFAGEAVTLCRQSLQTGAVRLAQKPGVGPLEPQLFIVRHLLILKEMVASVDLVQIERAADFSSVTGALSNLLWNTSTLLNPTALFQMASKSIPNFAETMTDAKIELDQSLKAICEELIAKAGFYISAPIRTYLTRSKQYLAAPIADTAVRDLTAQDWATPAQIESLHVSYLGEGGGLETSLRELLSKFKLWLTDKQAVNVLTAPIFEEAAESYAEFYSLVKSEYDFAVSSKLPAPTGVKDKIRVIGHSAGVEQTKK